MTHDLFKHRAQQKFEHALSYVRQAAGGPKKLNTSELALLNQMLTGNDEPWRMEPVSVTIPSGETHHFNILSNPLISARELLGDAQKMAGNGDVKDAAFYLYSQIVLHHLFLDANRRTAALAALWLVNDHGANLAAEQLEQYSMGDLRNSDDLAKLKTKIGSLITK